MTWESVEFLHPTKLPVTASKQKEHIQFLTRKRNHTPIQY